MKFTSTALLAILAASMAPAVSAADAARCAKNRPNVWNVIGKICNSGGFMVPSAKGNAGAHAGWLL